MPEAGQPTPSREDLRERWEQDKGSRIYLQLAEEHRRVGEHAEAVTVLEEGLQHRPRDLSGMVALGRCRLELGELEDAVLVLADVIARDPAHIVANKLLIQAHVARGDAAAARERLTVYRLLNDRDPELEDIERELSKLDAAAAPTPSASPAMQTFAPSAAVPTRDEAPDLVSEDDTAVSKRRWSSPPGGLPVEREAAGGISGGEGPRPRRDDLFTPSTAAAESRTDPARQGAPLRAEDREESTAVHDGGATEEGEDLGIVFDLSPRTAAIDLEELWRAATGRVAAGRSDPFGDLGSSAAAATVEPGGEIFALRPGEAVGDARLPGVPGAEAATVSEAASGIEVRTDTPVDDAVRDGRDELPPVAVTPSEPLPLPEEASPPLSEAHPEEAFAEDHEVVPHEGGEGSGPAAADLDGEATATLGNLYLAQGHHAEAARIFERVLERDPSHDAARQGLERAAGFKRRPALRASDLLASPELAGEVPAGLTAKKVLVLESYLRRLRPGSAASVR